MVFILTVDAAKRDLVPAPASVQQAVLDFPWWVRQERLCLQRGRSEVSPCVGTIPWRRKRQPLQYSCLENPMNRGAWQVTVHGGHKELDTTEPLSTAQHRLINTL